MSPAKKRSTAKTAARKRPAAKRSAAGKKAAATRKRKTAKRSTAGKKAAATRKRKTAKRSAAGKKAAPRSGPEPRRLRLARRPRPQARKKRGPRSGRPRSGRPRVSPRPRSGAPRSGRPPRRRRRSSVARRFGYDLEGARRPLPPFPRARVLGSAPRSVAQPMVTTSTDPSAATDAVRSPSVLVVLVVHDGASWLRECLASLAAQTHPRLGVVAVDNASTDDSRAILDTRSARQRVLASGRKPRRGRRHEGRDRAARGPEGGVSLGPARRCGARPRCRSSVGRGGDRYPRRRARRGRRTEGRRLGRPPGPARGGALHRPVRHPFTPLQDGEIDQGQYDRVLEVLFVSSCAMLIAREDMAADRAVRRAVRRPPRRPGLLLAGAPGRVPRAHDPARARHGTWRHAAGERRGEDRRAATALLRRAGCARLHAEGHGVLTLLWLLPVYAVVGVAPMVWLALASPVRRRAWTCWRLGVERGLTC